jgi:hypothetical protein
MGGKPGLDYFQSNPLAGGFFSAFLWHFYCRFFCLGIDHLFKWLEKGWIKRLKNSVLISGEWQRLI